MSNFAIRVENLGKQYRIGYQRERYRTIRQALVNRVKRLTEKRATDDVPENKIWALKEASFEVQHGEVVGIIGRNGAGKSTLLKLLAHITEPTEGRITLHGRVGSLLEVGTGFHPELTGRDNIYLNGAILGMRQVEIQRKFDEIVAFSEIEKFLDTPVKRYSSGMYVRLAFAVAAHLEPEILLVDEVLSVGDAAFQRKCMGKMSSVAKQGRTVLFVSHNLQAITTLCQNGILLSYGKIIYMGTASDTVSQYLQNAGSDRILEQNVENKERRPGEGIKVKITSISLSFPGTSAKMWEPLKFDIKFKCIAPYSTFGMSVEVWRLDGSCAFTTDSEDDDLTFTLDEGKCCAVSVVVPSPNLPPDRYIVRAVARSGGRVIDWIDEALVFDVFNKDMVSNRVSERHLGNRAHGFWRIESLV